MHHIFVENKNIDFANATVTLNAKDDYYNYNHLVNSLRVKINENILCSVEPFITSFDYKTKVIKINKEEIELLIEENVEGRELPIKVNLYQGLCKSDKFEHIIEKAVELGASEVVPLNAKNCIVKMDTNEKKLNAKLERYNKIAKSAAEQSKRHIIPKVVAPVDFLNLATFNKENVFNILFYENENEISKTKKALQEIKRNIINKEILINVFIGPEGGWTDDEVNEAIKSKFYILSLGKRILRTETASFAALSLIAYEFE